MNAKVSATKVCPGCSARYPPDALFCPNDGSPLTATPMSPHASPYALRESDAGLVTGGEGQDSYLGREISGHIEIRKLAGVGAMGRVYRAFQKGIDRDVAVKVLHRELSANQQLVARFHREAKVASRLQHPNVVQVHLAGQLPDGAMYIVMEYLDGLSLQSALAAAGGPLPLERALHIALQICDAAGEAHAQGVVHRDIKPENVMLVRRGGDPDFVKVLDFGIARLNWGEQSMATAAGLIFGTARYISPEGAQGEAVGPEGDVYAIATLLYQMVAGRTPFEGEQAVALLVQQIHDAPPPIRSLPGGDKVPAALADVIMKNLAKTPSERAPDGRTFGRSIVEAAKTFGLSPEDLVPRSSLFVPVPRPPSPVGPPVRAVAPVESGGGAETVREPSYPDFGPSASLPPGVTTRKWTPAPGAAAPTDGDAKVRVARVTGDGFPPSRPRPSSVETTLDDSSVVRLPPLTDARAVASAGTDAVANAATNLGRMRTEPGVPLDALGVNLPAPTPSPGPRLADTYIPRPIHPTRLGSREPEASPTDARAEAAVVRVEPAPPGEPAVQAEPRPRRRVVGVILICFLIGMMGGTAALYELGYLRSGAHAGSLDEAVAHADEALKHARWDTPPGDNVRDLTDAALLKWPHDPRIRELRARATDDLVKEAVGRKLAGDVPGALHWAKLASELDPTDTTAQRLALDYERGPTPTVDTAPSAPRPTPTPVVTRPVAPPAHGGAHPVTPATPATTPPKVAFEASLAHPHVGQPVSFTAKVLGARGVDEARFFINGPGLTADTRLGTIPEEGGAYQTTFTGFDAGKYEITFEAKIDGTLSRATRPVVIDAVTAPGTPSSPPATPPGPPSSAPSLPPAVPSGKWL